MAEAIMAPWKPAISRSPSFDSTTPSKAVATRPPMRATALLKPEAMATCLSSTEPSTDEVSGATAMAMPSAMTVIAGKTVVQ
jgi:hypothetical protein